tara:strand:+ start:45 stop:215 length:171 start_codon:yes stop_codon:yes gene_type:complete
MLLDSNNKSSLKYIFSIYSNSNSSVSIVPNTIEKSEGLGIVSLSKMNFVTSPLLIS